MIEQADADLRVALGLLDLRHLAGDPHLTLRLRSAMLAHWRRTARDRLPDLRDLVTRRHELMGELAHLSVPGPEGVRGRAARRHRAEGAGRDLAGRRTARGPRALATLAARRPRRTARGRRAGDRPDRPGAVGGPRRPARPGGRRRGPALRARAGAADHPPVAADVAAGRRRTDATDLGAGVPPARAPAGRAGHRAVGPRGRADQGRPAGGRPDAPAARGGDRRASETWSWRPRPRPGWSPSVRPCRTRGHRLPARRWCGCWPRGRGSSRSGRRSRRPAPSRRCCPSGSASGCCRTRPRSIGSPSTDTSSRPAWRRRR